MCVCVSVCVGLCVSLCVYVSHCLSFTHTHTHTHTYTLSLCVCTNVTHRDEVVDGTAARGAHSARHKEGQKASGSVRLGVGRKGE
jgi:hypothetical protein